LVCQSSTLLDHISTRRYVLHVPRGYERTQVARPDRWFLGMPGPRGRRRSNLVCGEVHEERTTEVSRAFLISEASASRDRAQEEPQVRRTFRESAHEVRVPGRSERDVHTDAVTLLRELFL